MGEAGESWDEEVEEDEAVSWRKGVGEVSWEDEEAGEGGREGRESRGGRES